MSTLFVRLLAACWLVAVLPAPAGEPTPAPLPADSIYRIPDLVLRDQRNERFAFASLRGRPHLVGMFYGSCKMVCPLEIETLKGIERAVDGRISVVLVTFDPQHDDVAVLRAVAREHRVRAPLFRLTRAEHGDERVLAGVLGIAYRQLPSGGYGHNVVIALIDSAGRIVATSDAFGTPDPAFTKKIRDLLGHE